MGAVLLHAELVEFSDVVLFCIAGALTGGLTLALLVIGQCWPRSAAMGAGMLAAMWVLSGVLPGLTPLFPWGWVAQLYPGQSGWTHLLPLGLIAVAFLAVVPVALENVRVDCLLAQASRWESTTSLACTLDFAAAASGYQAKPTRWRSTTAIRSFGNFIALFMVRDLIGAMRTPARAIFGALAVFSGGALFSVAREVEYGGVLFGVCAALMLFLGSGPFTDGIRHAAAVTSEQRIYGLGDRRLIVLHSSMPFLVCGILTLAGVVVGAAIARHDVFASALFAGLLLLGVLFTRVNGALKGMMPLSLLSSATSPMGDPMPLLRVVWSMDGPLLVVLAGSAAAGLLETWPYAVALAVVISATTTLRWRRRST
ncbi:hypothetical protein [Microbacterium rhizomatis]|uniref:Uncharacterized protein n=1 Tax=Microbacterium rhizomatis TaxID=1631477 RepID=A0A5J5IW96_9MICO|nr:hypothetical protein [Microbacterium rhizomatis]KAA9104984.1 hypothetical protein F6B43_18220 [Microbacterium rhizomatis]